MILNVLTFIFSRAAAGGYPAVAQLLPTVSFPSE
jgi:hypothetical protein